MINILCNLIAEIVFSGINGIVMIPILILSIYIIVGQVPETIQLFKEV